MISFGLCSSAGFSTCRSRSVVVRRTPYWTALNHLPDMVRRLGAVREVAAAARTCPGWCRPASVSARTRLVGLRAGVRLDVGEAAAEELLGAVDRELLDDRRRTRSRHSSACPDSLRHTCWSGPSPALRARAARDDVLRRDQLDLVLPWRYMFVKQPGNRKRAWLMMIAGLVMFANVAIWTIPV
jgi:hypothetical protein